MDDYIATFCPVCKDTTRALLLDDVGPPVVIGNVAFNFVRSTCCQVCNEKSHRYEFECDSSV